MLLDFGVTEGQGNYASNPHFFIGNGLNHQKKTKFFILKCFSLLVTLLKSLKSKCIYLVEVIHRNVLRKINLKKR